MQTSTTGLEAEPFHSPHRRSAPTAVVTALACLSLGLGSGLLLAPHVRPSLQGASLSWAPYEAYLQDAKYVDLTHAIHPKMPLYTAFTQPSVTAAGTSDGTTFSYGDSGFIATAYNFATDQMGTQLDPPAHWNEYGATISDIPATVALRPLVVIDLSAKAEGYHAQVADVLAWEQSYGRIPAGSAVLFRTDWSLKWESYYPGDGAAGMPSVGLEALKFLHTNRSILIHGHEPLDTDTTPSLEGEAWLMHHNFGQLEGVANLHLVPPAGALLSIGFAKILGGTGGYARLVAICPPSWPHGLSVADAPGAPLPTQPAPLRRGEDGVLRPSPGATPTEYCAPGWQEKGTLGCPMKR